jgi:hypothetical protein
VGVDNAAHRGFNTGFCQTLGVSNTEVLRSVVAVVGQSAFLASSACSNRAQRLPSLPGASVASGRSASVRRSTFVGQVTSDGSNFTRKNKELFLVYASSVHITILKRSITLCANVERDIFVGLIRVWG